MNNSSHIENSTNLTPLIASNNNENTPTISITNITETTTLSNSNESLTSQNQSEISFMCRICHCEEKSHIDLLISPCYCNGSLNFVHQACLQKWLQLTGTFNSYKIIYKISFKFYQKKVLKHVNYVIIILN